jgi:gluconokinase
MRDPSVQADTAESRRAVEATSDGARAESSRAMIGIDIGTTSTKAVAYALDGRIVAQHAIATPLLRPVPEAAEQEPQAIVEAVRGCVRAVAGACGEAGCVVLGVAFSAAMHSVILLDATGRPLTRSLTWADNRAAATAARIAGRSGATALARRTGTPIHPMSPLAKLAWLREAAPAVHGAAARVVGIKEFVLHALCGQWVVDHSIASATGLLDVARLDWDEEALALAGVAREQLSRLVPTAHAVPALSQAAATDLGLPAGTPLVVGANDGVLSNLGLDAIRPGEMALTIGTSGALRTVVDRPVTDPHGRTFCYVLAEGLWVVGAPVNNGAAVLQWARETFARALADEATARGQDPLDALEAVAARVPTAAHGLLFHPYLAGERAPHWNPALRASFFGLAPQHGLPEMLRAVHEGVILALRGALPLVEALVGRAGRLKAAGGFAHSALWRQMAADIFDRELQAPLDVESSCRGAAMLGLRALGHLPSLDAAGALLGAAHRHAPDATAAATYARLAPIFDALPGRLAQAYEAIAAFQREDALPADVQPERPKGPPGSAQGFHPAAVDKRPPTAPK